jgi:hypothetical protein
VRAYGEEGGVVAAALHLEGDVGDLRVQPQLHAHGEDARHFGVEHIARQAVFGDAEAHHAACERARLDDGHRMAKAAQVVGGRESRGPGAHDQHGFAGERLRRREFPALPQRLVAEEALD